MTTKPHNEKRNRLRLPDLAHAHGGVGKLVKPPVSNSGDFEGSTPSSPTIHIGSLTSEELLSLWKWAGCIKSGQRFHYVDVGELPERRRRPGL